MATPVTPVDNNHNIIGTSSSPTVVGGNVAHDAPDSGNPVKIGGVYYAVSAPALADLDRGNVRVNSASVLLTAITAAAGVPIDFTAGSADGNGAINGLNVANYPLVFNGVTWDRVTVPNATSRIVSAAASTNATSAKASAGKVFSIHGRNAAAAVRYLKLYNKASAPVVGTDTPTHTFALGNAADFHFSLEGRYFSTGIAYALTTGSADADIGALTAGDILGLNIDYA